jgi:hypothetical protein
MVAGGVEDGDVETAVSIEEGLDIARLRAWLLSSLSFRNPEGLNVRALDCRRRPLCAYVGGSNGRQHVIRACELNVASALHKRISDRLFRQRRLGQSRGHYDPVPPDASVEFMGVGGQR